MRARSRAADHAFSIQMSAHEYQGRLCTIIALHGGKSTSRVTGSASARLHFPPASTRAPPNVILTLLSGEGAARRMEEALRRGTSNSEIRIGWPKVLLISTTHWMLRACPRA